METFGGQGNKGGRVTIKETFDRLGNKWFHTIMDSFDRQGIKSFIQAWKHLVDRETKVGG
jgi:hypothetical protein